MIAHDDIHAHFPEDVSVSRLMDIPLMGRASSAGSIARWRATQWVAPTLSFALAGDSQSRPYAACPIMRKFSLDFGLPPQSPHINEGKLATLCMS